MIERFRTWYEHECASNAVMLEMLHSVPAERRSDPTFAEAVVLAAHLAACRENWLDRILTGGSSQTDWWLEEAQLADLKARFEKLEKAWTEYLDGLDDVGLEEDFEFGGGDGTRYRWSIEGQIVQLLGHAFYHRGQIAMIVKNLGGEPRDTDYLYWAIEKNPRYGEVKS